MKRQVWITGVIALAGVWALAGLGFWIANNRRMTAEKAVAYLREHHLTGLPESKRAQIIDGMAEPVGAATVLGLMSDGSAPLFI